MKRCVNTWDRFLTSLDFELTCTSSDHRPYVIPNIRDEKDISIKMSRIRKGEMPKYSAISPHTPNSDLSFEDFINGFKELPPYSTFFVHNYCEHCNDDKNRYRI